MTDFKVGDIVKARDEVGEIVFIRPVDNKLYVQLASFFLSWKCNAEDVMFIERKKEE